GQVTRHAVQRLGDNVEVLRGVQRHVDARHSADIAPPQTRAVDDHLTRDVAGIGAHAGRGAALAVDGGDGHVLDDRGTALSRSLGEGQRGVDGVDRKSTRLNSSHVAISYAVFCVKKKKLQMNV